MQALPPSRPTAAALPAPASAADGNRSQRPARPVPPAQEAEDAADTTDVADAAAALIPVQRQDRARLSATTLVRFPPGRTRPRGTPVQDCVVFTATCPACGQDCEWAERRDDTRLSAVVHCSCSVG